MQPKISSCDSRRSGFTLIELLIVIGIIVIIASLVIVSVSKARTKGRDSKRIADLASIQLAMEMYKDARGYYYAGTFAPGSPTNFYDWGHTVDSTKLAELQSYLSPIPADPIKNNSKYRYQFKVYNTPVDRYWLRARMENSENYSENGGKCYFIWGGKAVGPDGVDQPNDLNNRNICVD